MKIVLLIEDNNDIRENTCEMLELEGFKVIVAANGKIGLALAKEHKIDIILCDIMMPIINGYEVYNTIKNNPETASIPFIFLTASAEKSEVKAGLGMGADGYIRKPFEAEELFGAIARCLHQG